jgi:hypothetical protein
MRHFPLVVLVLLTAALGCFHVCPERCESRRAPQGPGRFDGPSGEDVVQMEIALLECPAGDRFLNHDLWDGADEQGVNLECKPVLETNGFRVGQVGGLLPARLQALLTAPRSCPDPRRVQTHAGTPTPVLLGAVGPRCTFRLEHDGCKEVALGERAQCVLRLVPTLADEGRVLLRFTPEVQHGRSARALEAAKDPAGELRWAWEEKRPAEVYDWLAWEVTVAPNEYVVVGTRLDRPGTLGQRCFLTSDEAPRQRLLVIRTAPVSPEQPAEALRRAPPLALQASWTSARGCSP